MCKHRYGIDGDEEAMTEGEEDSGNPFGSGPDAEARLRAAEGALSTDADPMAADANNAVATPTSCRDIPSNAPDSYRLGKHFTVATLSSRAALPHTIPAQTAKGLTRAHVICNMRHLVVNCLDPLWEHYTAEGYRVSVSSGFRNATNGSDHNAGAAADLIFHKDGQRLLGADLSRIVKYINEVLKLPYTQMIHEANRIIHIACRPSGNSGTRLYWSTGYGSPVSGLGYRHQV